jgi:hypothetical protein
VTGDVDTADLQHAREVRGILHGDLKILNAAVSQLSYKGLISWLEPMFSIGFA